MKMMKTLPLIMISMLISTTLFAQEKIKKNQSLSPEQKAVLRIEKMKTIIELEEAQEKEIKKQLVAFYTQKQALDEEKRSLNAKIKALKDENRKKMNQLLTDEQKIKLREAKQNRKKKKDND